MPLYHNRTDGQVELVVAPEVLYQTMRELYIYCAEGIVLATVNIPILLMVAFFPVLRKEKEMIMVAGISFADGFHGVALIVAAIGRISLITSGNGEIISTISSAYSFLNGAAQCRDRSEGIVGRYT
uniref:Uncharacterized protein n=1 Tax=Plectus sambesii TaxID=2011161 RepID=A0A914XG11_9BILA